MIPVMDPQTSIPLTVRIWHDTDMDDPHDACDGQWTLHQFSNRHAHYTDPDSFGLTKGDDGKLVVGDKELRKKLRRGLAFFVSYYEHGRCHWSIRGTGPQCRWDSVGLAGVIVWEHDPSDLGAKTIKAREKDAAAFLETYTAWCNGDVFGFTVDDPEDDIHDSCGGFYGNDTACLLEAIHGACGQRPVIFKGDASDLSDDYPGVTYDPDIHEGA